MANPMAKFVPNRFQEPTGEGVLRLCGGDGSPYSNKMLALMKYRRIPFRWLGMASPEAAGTPDAPGPVLAPKLLFPDNTVMNDSTFIIKELEKRYPNGRTVIPPSPALGFLAAIFEDYCDEWVTKAMFHFRWTYDIETAGFGIGTMPVSFAAPIQAIRTNGKGFGDRQVARLRDVVGSNETTGPVIEQSFERLLKLLEEHLHAGHAFLFGSRPSAADFALFGQLHPMISLDPETSRKVFSYSRSAWFWYHSMKELSGVSLKDENAGWFDPSSLPPTLKALMAEVGRLYAPFMLANAEAVQRGQADFECRLDDGKVLWRQASFKYQAKCLGWLREHYVSLPIPERQVVDSVLAGTGCAAMLKEQAVASSKL